MMMSKQNWSLRKTMTTAATSAFLWKSESRSSLGSMFSFHLLRYLSNSQCLTLLSPRKKIIKIRLKTNTQASGLSGLLRLSNFSASSSPWNGSSNKMTMPPDVDLLLFSSSTSPSTFGLEPSAWTREAIMLLFMTLSLFIHASNIWTPPGASDELIIIFWINQIISEWRGFGI